MWATVLTSRIIFAICACFVGLAAACAAQSQTGANTSFTREVITFIKLFEAVHYNRANVPSSRYSAAIADFMAELDGQRIFFLESDRINLTGRLGPQLYQQLAMEGSTACAAEIAQVYWRRLKERAVWIESELARGIDFVAGETLRLNRVPMSWPGDAAAADDLWRRRLKFEVLAEMLNNHPFDRAKEIVRDRYKQLAGNGDESEGAELNALFLSTIAKLFDPHSEYYGADTFAEFGLPVNATTAGLQLEQVAGRWCVKQLDHGSAAEKSGEISVGDRIFAVGEGESAPVETFGLTARKMQSMLRGARGTLMRVVIEPAGRGDMSVRKQVSLLRGDVGEVTRARAAIVRFPSSTGATPFGLVQVPSFYGVMESTEGEKQSTSSADIAYLLHEITASGVSGVVLDLRGNGGGYLNESIAAAGLFLGGKVVARIRNHEGELKVEMGRKEEAVYSGPLVVLVDRLTASGAEIVAGALQAHRRAIVVGGSGTHGNGSIQQVVEMKQLLRALALSKERTGAAKFTIQKFYLPDGTSTQLRGVIPDIMIPSLLDEVVRGEAALPRALPWDEIKVDFDSATDVGLVARMRERSQARRSEHEEFRWLQQVVDLQRRTLTEDVSLDPATRTRRKDLLAEEWNRLEARERRLADAFKAEWIDFPAHGAMEKSKPAVRVLSYRVSTVDVTLLESFRILADMAARK